MKLTRLFVDGYKNLIECDLSLYNFNVIIGSNNSGKSNLLELFSFLDFIIYGSDEARNLIFETNHTPGRNTFIPLRKSINSNNSLSINIEFTDEISGIQYKYAYSINILLKRYVDAEKSEGGFIANESFKYKNVKSTGVLKTIFERTNGEITKFISSQRLVKIDDKESALSIINKLKDMKNELNEAALKGLEGMQNICKTPVIYSSPNEIKSQLVGVATNKETIIKNGRIAALNLTDEIYKILKSDYKDYFIEVLNDILGIKDFDVFELHEKNVELDFKLLFVRFENSVLSQLHQLSDGTIVTLNLITYLFTNRYPIIAIEELENSIHPKLLQKIIRLIKDSFSDIQIIITTHSPVLINMVQIDDVSIISSREFGLSEVCRVKDKKDLVKKLSNPFSSFGDIFFTNEEC